MIQKYHVSLFNMTMSIATFLLIDAATTTTTAFHQSSNVIINHNVIRHNHATSHHILFAAQMNKNQNELHTGDDDKNDIYDTNRRSIFTKTFISTLLPMVVPSSVAFTPLSSMASSDVPTTTLSSTIRYGDNENIMIPKEHGTSATAVQSNLLYHVNVPLADQICNYNRHFAEPSGYFMKSTTLLSDIEKAAAATQLPMTFYDSVTGVPLFRIPGSGRTVQDFIIESQYHGWPSFRDNEVIWDNVRILRSSGGEVVSTTGTHLGHNLPDRKGNRYCINLVSISGQPVSTTAQNMNVKNIVSVLGCISLYMTHLPTHGIFTLAVAQQRQYSPCYLCHGNKTATISNPEYIISIPSTIYDDERTKVQCQELVDDGKDGVFSIDTCTYISNSKLLHATCGCSNKKQNIPLPIRLELEEEESVAPSYIPVPVLKSPLVVKATKVPKVEKGTKVPKVEKGTKEPKVEKGTKVPKVEKGTKEPKVEKGTKAPKVEKGTKEPKVEKGTKVPKVEKGTKEPKVEKGTKAPKEEKGTKVPKTTTTKEVIPKKPKTVTAPAMAPSSTIGGIDVTSISPSPTVLPLSRHLRAMN